MLIGAHPVIRPHLPLSFSLSLSLFLSPLLPFSFSLYPSVSLSLFCSRSPAIGLPIPLLPAMRVHAFLDVDFVSATYVHLPKCQST